MSFTHKLKSALGYVRKNGGEWDLYPIPMPAPTRDVLWNRGRGNSSMQDGVRTQCHELQIHFLILVRFHEPNIFQYSNPCGWTWSRNRYLDTFSKNDVISSVRKHYCALELWLGLELAGKRFRINVYSSMCSWTVEISWHLQGISNSWR